MASTEFATRSHKSAGFLFLLALALVAVAAGFAFAPHYSWQVTKIARQASELGLQSGALFVGGLVCFGLGLVARTAGPSTPTYDSRGETEALQSEMRILNEQVSNKLAQLRTTLLQVQDGLSAMTAQQQAQAQDQSARALSGDQARDAIFRLAASLDKLHAHLDERVHAVDLQLRSGFESLFNASQDLRRLLDQGGLVGARDASSGVHPGSFPAHASEGGIDFYETMQKLDAIAGTEPAHPGVHASEPQPPFPHQAPGANLDVLLPEEYRDRY
jgi:hypothetical protein